MCLQTVKSAAVAWADREGSPRTVYRSKWALLREEECLSEVDGGKLGCLEQRREARWRAMLYLYSRLLPDLPPRWRREGGREGGGGGRAPGAGGERSGRRPRGPSKKTGERAR